jgi:hypothetical protein
VLSGEIVTIPYRIYAPERSADRPEALLPIQRAIMDWASRGKRPPATAAQYPLVPETERAHPRALPVPSLRTRVTDRSRDVGDTSD